MTTKKRTTTGSVYAAALNAVAGNDRLLAALANILDRRTDGTSVLLTGLFEVLEQPTLEAAKRSVRAALASWKKVNRFGKRAGRSKR